MPDIGSNVRIVSSSRLRWVAAALGALFTTQVGAAPADNLNLVRDLAGRVGPMVGSALACPDVARSRIQSIVDKFQAVIKANASNEAERDDLSRLLDRYVADGRNALTAGRTNCRTAERQLADLEQSLAGRSAPLISAIGPTPHGIARTISMSRAPTRLTKRDGIARQAPSHVSPS